MVHVKETEADEVVHEVTINILGLSGIVGGGPIDLGDATLSSSSSLSPHSLTSMKAAIAVLYKNRAQHFGAPLSERLQYVPTNEQFIFQSDDNDLMVGRPTVIDPQPHYTAIWKRQDGPMTAASTASFDCTLRVSADGKAKPRRFELVTALVGCNSENKTLAAMPVGVCDLIVGHGGESHSKQIMELPVRRVTKQHGYPSLHIPNPDFKYSSELTKHKQDSKKRRRAILRFVVKKGMCYRCNGATTGEEDNNDDLLSRDCKRTGGGDSSLTGSSGYSIASKQQHIQAAHLEKAVLRVEVEWKIKEFFEVYLEDPLLDRVPRTAPRRPKLKSPEESTIRLLSHKRDQIDEWGDDDPFRSAPLAAGALITAAFSEAFSCVAPDTTYGQNRYDFHARFLETTEDSRALEDIACGVPLLSMAASPSKRGNDEERRTLLRETLADCIVHEDIFPILPLEREVSDNSTCNGGIHSSSDPDDSSSFDFLEHLMLGEHEHDAELEQGYEITNDNSFSTNQSSYLLNSVPSMASRLPILHPTKPIEIPEEETANQIGKEKQVAKCADQEMNSNRFPGLESSIPVSRPKTQDDLYKVFDIPEVDNGLHVVPYLSIEGDSFLLGDKRERSTLAMILEMRLPSPIQEQPEVRKAVMLDTKPAPMQTKPKPNPNQKPIEWIQFDQSADLQSLLTDTADYIKPTQSILEARFPRKTVMKRKIRRGNPFPSLAIIEEKLKIETHQSQNAERYSKASPLGLQITFPQDGVLDDVSSQEAGQNYFTDFEDALDDSFWNGQETRAKWNGMGMLLATTAEYAKDASSFQFESDEKSI